MRVTARLTALRARWVERYAVPAPDDMTAPLLALAIAWQEQADTHGDVAPALLRDLHVIARSERDRRRGVPQPAGAEAADLPASSRLVPGTKLVKVYRGATHVVEVGEGTFDWDGRSFASLSAVARAMTGTHWNGLLFFGLRVRRVKPRHERSPAAAPAAPAARAPRVAKAARHA